MPYASNVGTCMIYQANYGKVVRLYDTYKIEKKSFGDYGCHS